MSQINESLFGKTKIQIEEIVLELGLPRFKADQLCNWLYKKSVGNFGQMANLGKITQEVFCANFEEGLSEPLKETVSVDGTKKYLFEVSEGKFVEAAYIPEGDRHTLCVSSQVGCKMGCSFCMTARQGFVGNLTAGQILNQLRSIPERELITNIVFMGMGEPLDNLDEVMQAIEILTSDYGYGKSPRRITLSTIGVLPQLRLFLQESSCNLAVSLHSPFDYQRQQLVPAQKVHPVKEIIETIRAFAPVKQQRVSFEYIVFKGLNHSPEHVKGMARLLNGLRCRINLITFHPIPGSNLVAPNEQEMDKFKEALEAKGIVTTIRKSRGQDIDAACGLLSTKLNQETVRGV